MRRIRSFPLGIEWDDLGRLLSWFVPFAFAAARLPLESQWRDDLPLLRAFGLAPGVLRGGASTALMQLAALLPFGSRPFRGALVSAAALGACALLTYEIARRALAANAKTPRLTPALACLAALGATLSPPFPIEGTVAGGATIACLPLLGAVLLARGGAGPAGMGRPIAQGALAGAALAECPPLAGAVLLLALLASPSSGGARNARGEGEGAPKRRAAFAFAASALATAAMLAAPSLLRPFAPRASGDPPFFPALAEMALFAAPPPTAFRAWLDDLGPLSMGLAAAGVTFGLLRKRLRAETEPLLLLALLDLLLSARLPLPPWVAGAAPAARLAAVAALSVMASVGVQSLLTLLEASPIRFARPAAVLLFVFDLTMVTTAAEQAGPAADRSEKHGAAFWTDEALLHLAPRAAVLARSPEIIERIGCAALSEGVRPDVLLVPMPFVGQGDVAASLLGAEPRIRDLLTAASVEGTAGESALSALAAVRPIVAELDPSWDRRVIAHLVAEPLWHRFAYEPRGASDRRAGWSTFVPAVHKVLEGSRDPSGGDSTASGGRDTATAAVLARATREQMAVAAVLGDRDEAIELASLVQAIGPADAGLEALKRRIETMRSGLSAGGGAAVDLRSLLR